MCVRWIGNAVNRERIRLNDDSGLLQLGKIIVQKKCNKTRIQTIRQAPNKPTAVIQILKYCTFKTFTSTNTITLKTYGHFF